MIEPRLPDSVMAILRNYSVLDVIEHESITAFGKLVKVLKKQPAVLEAMLFYTAHQGKMGYVRQLLKDGVNVNAVDKLHRTALMYAVDSLSFKTVTTLLEAGADTSIISDNKKTVAFYAKSDEMQALLYRFSGTEDHVVKWLTANNEPLNGQKVIALFPVFNDQGQQTTWIAAEAVFSGRCFSPMPELLALKPCVLEKIGGWIPYPRIG